MHRFAYRAAAFSGLAVILPGCSRTASETASSGPPPAAAPAGAGRTATATATPPPFIRPPLVSRSGSHFQWEMPEDWKPTENANGVMLQSPDDKLIVNNMVLIGSPGQTDPWSFLSNVLTVGAGIRDIQCTSTRDEPSLPSAYPGIRWKVQSFEFTFTDPNLGARRAAATVGICNAYGGYSALYQAFSTPPDKFDEGKTWLPLLCESIKSINNSTIGNIDHVQLAQNHPLDNSALMASWKARWDSGDRISQQNRETTMGYERMKSPIDGRMYNMPFENFDGTMGGYRDPADRNQILKRAPTGE